jgi:hypothetical protein
VNERRHTPDTCNWILQTEEYLKWRNVDSEQNCLWIHGKVALLRFSRLKKLNSSQPGSGKSVLAAFLVSVLLGDNQPGRNLAAEPVSCSHPLHSLDCDIDRQHVYTPSVLYFFGMEVKGSSALVFLGTLIHQLLMKFDEDENLISMVQRYARESTEPSEELLVTLLIELAEAVGVL